MLGAVEKRGELDNTLVLYLGDNGFLFGEHGLIDKRCAYEESMRIPMLARWPKGISGGTKVKDLVANIDVGPTLLAAAGIATPDFMDGSSFLRLAQGLDSEWREELLYEYYWERNYPQTPTVHALRGERYKYVRYHGVWDVNELYDLQEDPHERRNLINDPAHAERVKAMNERLFAELAATKGIARQPAGATRHRAVRTGLGGVFDPGDRSRFACAGTHPAGAQCSDDVGRRLGAG